MSTNKIAVCLRDVPKFDNLADDLNFLITSDFSYIKFYGKNQENWWQPLTEEDRTHYLYNQKILTKWFKNINEKLINNIEDLFIVFNNVKEGNAILNSEYLRKKLLVKPAIDNYQLELPL